MILLRAALWLTAFSLPALGPPPLDPVASWVLASALVLTLGALSFFLVRTYNRIDGIEASAIKGRKEIMDVVEKGHGDLAAQIGRLVDKMESQGAAIVGINKEIGLRVDFAKTLNEQNLREHQQMLDQLKGMAKDIAERRYGPRIKGGSE